MFKQNGRYFIITSAATGWDPNQAQYSSATNIAGPWGALTNLGNNTTFDTQSTYVIPVQGSQATTYIYAGDRWQDPDLLGSKYIWLPLKVSGTSLALDYYADWQLNVTTGVWSQNDGYLPQTGWTLLRSPARRRRGRTAARPTRSTTRRRRSGTPSTRGPRPVPARDPDRSRRDVRAGRFPLPAPAGQNPTARLPVPVLCQHRPQQLGHGRRSGTFTTIAARSA